MPTNFKHPYLIYTQDVTEIAKPLKQLGITFFTYMRNYYNGERVALYSNGCYFEEYYTKKYYLVGNTESRPENYKKQCVLWSTLPNQRLYDAIPRAHGIDHGMFMIYPNKDYCEFFGFGAQKENYQIINTYLTRLDYLQSFNDYFKEKTADIIKASEKIKFILPHNDIKLDFVNESNNFNLLDDQLSLSTLISKKRLTTRQIECSIHLMSGKTAKEIAGCLGLSTRTVEYYLDNIRTKLGCKNKAELITKLTKTIKLN